MSEPTIQPLQADHVEQAKKVICTVVAEFFYPDTQTDAVQQLLEAYDRRKELDDISNFETHYSANDGLFLVLVDGDEVVGTGAIRKLDAETAELKRMWLLPPYRGRGLGREMAETLLRFAQSHNYKWVRLDTDSRQHQAAKLYQRLGFQKIDRYNNSVCDCFMELDLTTTRFE